MSRLAKALYSTAAVVLLAVPTSAAAIEFQFDYRYDQFGFLNDPDARLALEAAADTFSVLWDDLSPIAPSGRNTWSAVFRNPSHGSTTELPNFVVPSDTLVVFVGGHDLPGERLGEGGPGGFSAQGTPSWLNTIYARGEGQEADVIGPSAHEFAPWGGTITFDTTRSDGEPRAWHFDSETEPARFTADLFSVALHELGHLLGFGTSSSFQNHVMGGSFHGPQVLELSQGEPVRLEPDQAHWAAETYSPPWDSEGQIVAMDPTIVSVNGYAERRPFTALDFAALDDLGWTVDPSVYLAPREPIPGDYNDNGVVEQADLDLVLLNWNRLATAVPPDWVNEPPTGRVDQAELDGVLLHWGDRTASAGASGLPMAAAGVPEPSAAGLSIVALLSIALLKRAKRLVAFTTLRVAGI